MFQTYFKCCFCKELTPVLFSIFLFAYFILISVNLTVLVDFLKLIYYSFGSLCVKGCIFWSANPYRERKLHPHKFWFAVFLYHYSDTCVKFKTTRNVSYEFRLFGGISRFPLFQVSFPIPLCLNTLYNFIHFNCWYLLYASAYVQFL